MNIFLDHSKSSAILFFLLTFLAETPRGSKEVSKRGLPDGSVVNKCPDKWDNPFCICDVNRNTLTITIHCKSVEKSEQLKGALDRPWNNKRFEWFLIEHSNVTSLPGGIFNGLSFVGFIANDNVLDGIEKDSFKGSEDSAQYVWMSDNKFPSGFNFKSLQPLKKLVSITILNSKPRLEIPDEPFKSLSHLETINLENNGIESLGKNFLDSLPKLRRVDLSWNKLTKLKNNVFNTSGCEKSIALILVHNEISEIEDEAFANLNTHYISLQYNKLTTLKRSVFEPLLNRMAKRRYTKILLQGNPFVCDSSFDWLEKKPVQYRKRIIGVPCLDDDRD